jgi:transposase InsO family protein
MSGKSPLSATKEQQTELAALAGSRDRGEADRARADFRKLLKRYGMRGSMSRKGDRWDNAVTGTLFGIAQGRASARDEVRNPAPSQRRGRRLAGVL